MSAPSFMNPPLHLEPLGIHLYCYPSLLYPVAQLGGSATAIHFLPVPSSINPSEHFSVKATHLFVVPSSLVLAGHEVTQVPLTVSLMLLVPVVHTVKVHVPEASGKSA